MKRIALMIAATAFQLPAQVAPLNSEGVSMGHLHILTSDAAAHKKLWVDTLGGKLVKAGPLELVKFPGVLVAFRDGKPEGGTDGSVVDHLGFAVRDYEGVKAKLKPHIVSENPQNRQFFAMFPNDVRVEFTEDTKMDGDIRHHHIHFATPHIAEMRAWYAKVFGAVPGTRGQFQAADLPGVNLSWKPAEKAPVASKGRSVDHIGFEVKDIRAACSKAEAAGATVEMQPTARPDLGLTIAFLTDPWGTRIELTEGLAKL